MVKFLLLLGGLFIAQLSYSQEYSYSFQVTDVSNPGEAKEYASQIRDILGIQQIKFDDAVDRYTILTHLDFDVEEMKGKLEENGVMVYGSISKINIE